MISPYLPRGIELNSVTPSIEAEQRDTWLFSGR
jgi:hypothetical protein